MATAAVLYLPPISAAVGRRQLVVTIHVYSGLLLPIPCCWASWAGAGASGCGPTCAG